MNGISNATNMSTTDKADQFDPATDEINTFLSDFEFSMQDVPRSQWMKPLRGRLHVHVRRAMHEFEKGLVADRGVDGRGAPLPAFRFFDYEEMCRFLTDRFHNKLADRDGVHDILYGGRGRGLDASTCITAIDAKAAVIDSRDAATAASKSRPPTPLSDLVKIAALEERLRPEVKSALRFDTSTHDLTWTAFCEAARAADRNTPRPTPGPRSAPAKDTKAKVYRVQVSCRSLDPFSAKGVEAFSEDSPNPAGEWCRYCKSGLHPVCQCTALWHKRNDTRSTDGEVVKATPPAALKLCDASECISKRERPAVSVAAVQAGGPTGANDAGLPMFADLVGADAQLIQTDKGMLFAGEIAGVPARVFVDQGADICLVSDKWALANLSKLLTKPTPIQPFGLKNYEGGVTNSTRQLLGASLKIGNYAGSAHFACSATDSGFDAIVGVPWLRKNNATLNLGAAAKDRMIVRPPGMPVVRISAVHMLVTQPIPTCGGANDVLTAGVRRLTVDAPTGHTAPGAPTTTAPSRGEVEFVSGRSFDKLRRKAMGGLKNVFMVMLVAAAAYQLSTVADVSTTAARAQTPCSVEVAALVDQTHPSAFGHRDRLLATKRYTTGCLAEIPHTTAIKRDPEDFMSIKDIAGADIPPPSMRKVPYHLQVIVAAYIKDMTSKGWIVPSTSTYCSPIILIPKEGQPGEWRVVVDLRAVNQRSVKHHHRMPDILSCWDRLAKARRLSVIDLTKSYYQFPIADDGSREKTAFWAAGSLWEYTVCPMGFVNSGAHFQQRIEAKLRAGGVLNTSCVRVTQGDKPDHTPLKLPSGAEPTELGPDDGTSPYLDDLILFSGDGGDPNATDLVLNDCHDGVCRKVLDCLCVNDLYCHAKKCHWFCTLVRFVGAIAGNGILAMDPAKVSAIDAWNRPTTGTEIRSFLGMANFYRRFVKGFADIAAPLTNLLKKGTNVRAMWTDECTTAFDSLRGHMQSYPILRLPDFSKPFFIVTDAMKGAVGGALMQLHDGKLHPVAYYSKRLTPKQCEWPVRELECYGIVCTVEHFESYLLGSPFTFIVQNDHESLQWIKTARVLKGRVARWAETLANFHYEIQYIRGPTNWIGDGISRSLGTASPTSTATPSVTATAADHQAIAHILATQPVFPLVQCNAIFRAHDARFDNLDFTACPELGPIFANLGDDTAATLPAARFFERVGDKLFYVLRDGTMPLCIPSTATTAAAHSDGDVTLREALISECHDSPYLSHRGAARTYTEISKLFFWRGLNGQVKRFCASCQSCARGKASSRKTQGALHAPGIASAPMNSISMDFMTNMPEVQGFNQILVVVDRFTKLVFLLPAANTDTAAQIAYKLYAHVFSKFGWPLEIISDRDSKFVSAMWSEFFEANGTRLSLSYAYHQRFDGQTERMIRTIEEIMRMNINFAQDNWLALLPDIASTINNTTNPSTRMSPNQIHFGRRPNRPVELAAGRREHFPAAADLLDAIQYNQDVAHEAVRLAMTNYTTQFNAHANIEVDDRLRVGSKVFITATAARRPNDITRPSKKLLDKKHGPYTIIEKLSDVSFRLQLPDGCKAHDVFHANALHAFLETDEFTDRLPLEPAPVLVAPDGREGYVISSLDGRRKYRSGWRYFVIYDGFGPAHGEWVDRDDLIADVPEMVTEYDLSDPLPEAD